MEGMTFASKNHRLRFLLLALLSLLSTLSATAKIATDFDPNLDFSKFKSFAFIGGVEQLVRPGVLAS
jgi:hypothetical protein